MIPPWGTARVPVAEAEAIDATVLDAVARVGEDMTVDGFGRTALARWSRQMPRGRRMTSRDCCLCRTQHDQTSRKSDMCGGNAGREDCLTV